MRDILDEFNKRHHDFHNGDLHGDTLDPYYLFEEWMKEAVESGELEPNAFVLSTANGDAHPSSRILYLKDMIDHDFVFYTNYLSKKGQDIAANPKVSMLFFWPRLARQIRIEGSCRKAPESMSDAYFNDRPRGSQVGAWASKQSADLEDRDRLERRAIELESEFQGDVPRPDFWGGYRIEPVYFEFWQGRPSRLHDRLVFEGTKDYWTIKRIYP